MGFAVLERPDPTYFTTVPVELPRSVVFSLLILPFMRATVIPIDSSLAVDAVVAPMSFIDYVIFASVEAFSLEHRI